MTIPETMRAVLFYGPKEIRLEMVPVPRPREGEVLLKIGAALTCGTDFKAYRQGHRMLFKELPSPFGHELAGTVVEVGPGVADFRPGMRVVAANSAPCDGCFFCDRGQPQLCDALELHNGAYAEYNCSPAGIVRRNLYPIGDAVDFHIAALCEPLACAIHAVDALAIRPGERVAIIGAGMMALLLVEALKDRGAEITVIGRSPEPLERALAIGAHKVVSAEKSDPVEQVRAFSDGRGADCVFEAVGKPETWTQAIDMVRKGGKVCLFGGCAQGTRVPVDAHRVHYGQVSLFGVFHHTPAYFRQALELLSSGKVRTDLLISGEIPLDDVPGYFKRMSDHPGQKVAVLT